MYLLSRYLVVQILEKNMILCGLHENDKMSKWHYSDWISTIQRNTISIFLCITYMGIYCLKICTSEYQGNT
jgi:hypothetical protein